MPAGQACQLPAVAARQACQLPAMGEEFVDVEVDERIVEDLRRSGMDESDERLCSSVGGVHSLMQECIDMTVMNGVTVVPSSSVYGTVQSLLNHNSFKMRRLFVILDAGEPPGYQVASTEHDLVIVINLKYTKMGYSGFDPDKQTYNISFCEKEARPVSHHDLINLFLLVVLPLGYEFIPKSVLLHIGDSVFDLCLPAYTLSSLLALLAPFGHLVLLLGEDSASQRRHDAALRSLLGQLQDLPASSFANGFVSTGAAHRQAMNLLKGRNTRMRPQEHATREAPPWSFKAPRLDRLLETHCLASVILIVNGKC